MTARSSARLPRRRRGALVSLGAVLFALNLASDRVGSARATDAAEDEARVAAVMFYSRLCGACVILHPRLEAAATSLADQSLDLVVLDQTLSLFSGGDLDAQALSAGVDQVWAANKGKTGFALLVDLEDQSVLDVIVVRDDQRAIHTKLSRAMTRANAAN